MRNRDVREAVIHNFCGIIRCWSSLPSQSKLDIKNELFMKYIAKILPTIALLILIATGQPYAKDIVFENFSPDTVTVMNGPSGGQIVNGNVTVTTNTDALTCTGITCSGWIYNPTGQLKSIEFYIDYQNIRTFGQGQAFGILAVQDGNFFQGSYEITSYYPELKSYRAAADFGKGLDFSYGAKPITFGFYTANSSGGACDDKGTCNGIKVTYSNVKVTLHTSCTEITGIKPQQSPAKEGTQIDTITNPPNASVKWKVIKDKRIGDADADITQEGASATLYNVKGQGKITIEVTSEEACETKEFQVDVGCQACGGGGDCNASGGGDASL